MLFPLHKRAFLDAPVRKTLSGARQEIVKKQLTC